MVAALFVAKGGCYFGLPDVDPWDEERDARKYPGPWPVVAHPPCERWCQLAGLVEHRYGHKKGDDGGTFASALASVRKWGGVLEHPAFSAAFPAHGLPVPGDAIGWQRDITGGWVCEVAQSAYGHLAQKLTWLYYVGEVAPPSMRWETPAGTHKVSFFSDTGSPQPGLSKKQRSATPVEFRDLLLACARGPKIGGLE
jgi:hypothetical protein